MADAQAREVTIKHADGCVLVLQEAPPLYFHSLPIATPNPILGASLSYLALDIMVYREKESASEYRINCLVDLLELDIAGKY